MSHTYSIILPVRNGGHYVKECVNSILLQTNPNFNLIVLDNCSTDGTIEWINSLHDHRIVIYKAAQSLTIEQNWARITTVPKHEFITLIGHDDILDLNYLDTMNALITKYPDASLYQTHFRYINANGNKVRSCMYMEEKQYASEFVMCQMMQTIDSTGTGYMLRSKDYDAIGGISADYPKLIFADYELWIRIMLKSYKATSPAECFSYRVHDSVSRLTNGEEYQQAFEKYVIFLNELKNKDKKSQEVIEMYAKKMLLYYCESLSHRLLKTPLDRRGTTVHNFITKCEGYAMLLIPGQSFNPLLNPRILAASLLDNKLGLKIFELYKNKLARQI